MKHNATMETYEMLKISNATNNSIVKSSRELFSLDSQLKSTMASSAIEYQTIRAA